MKLMLQQGTSTLLVLNTAGSDKRNIQKKKEKTKEKTCIMHSLSVFFSKDKKLQC
jgi:hypothetical protein